MARMRNTELLVGHPVENTSQYGYQVLLNASANANANANTNTNTNTNGSWYGVIL
jgi:hypothetical protein